MKIEDKKNENEKEWKMKNEKWRMNMKKEKL